MRRRRRRRRSQSGSGAAVVLLALGSRGDVQPLAALAAALCARSGPIGSGDSLTVHFCTHVAHRWWVSRIVDRFLGDSSTYGLGARVIPHWIPALSCGSVGAAFVSSRPISRSEFLNSESVRAHLLAVCTSLAAAPTLIVFNLFTLVRARACARVAHG